MTFILNLTGCGFGSVEPEIGQKEDEVQLQEETVTYDRTCLVDENASHESVQAALYDYVGAVYAKKDTAVFDGKLTYTERSNVESIFGRFETTMNAKDYLNRVRRVVSTTLPQPVYCQQPGADAHLESYQNKTLGSCYELGVTHNCIDSILRGYVEIELNVVAHPESWVFFIEANSEPHSLATEKYFFGRVAQALGIQTYDATVPPHDEEFLQKVESHGLSRLEYAFMDLYATLQSLQARGRLTPELIRQQITETSANYNVSFDDLDGLVLKHLVPALDPQQAETQKERTDALMDRLLKAYIDHGNPIAAQRAQKILAHSPSQYSLFVYGLLHGNETNGIAHLVYQE